MFGSRCAVLAVVLGVSWMGAVREGEGAGQGGYDPLAVSGKAAEPLDLVVKDKARDRAIPVWVYLPEATATATAPAPVVLFSHGLGGSRRGSRYLGAHWAARGYVAVFLQHPGSDEDVWKGVPLRQRWDVLKKAANGENMLSRVKDVPAVLDQLAVWNEAKGHALEGRLDLSKVGMSGHSFGAVTTQAVSGSRYPAALNFKEKRIKSAVVMSPSVPRWSRRPNEVFGGVAIPWLLMTGTADGSPIGGVTTASRREVFAALAPGDKYELVLKDAEHSAFTDRALPGDALPRNPSHHRAILAISTAFWDATLKGDAKAQAWLDGEGPRSVLEAGDEWTRK